MAPILELERITKRFPGVLANDNISFSLEEGEIHGLLGENGAGKTTLMNILYGLYAPDEGEIRIRGERVQITSPGDAIQAEIGMVHQHFMLVPVFTVTENVMLGDEPTKYAGILDRETTADRIRDISSSEKVRGQTVRRNTMFVVEVEAGLRRHDLGVHHQFWVHLHEPHTDQLPKTHIGRRHIRPQPQGAVLEQRPDENQTEDAGYQQPSN